MLLTPKGAHAAQLGHMEKHTLGRNLMLGMFDINEFLQSGVCYDSVAFVRYLLGARITNDDLLRISGNDWLRKFDFEHGSQWDGRSPIPHGTAIGFANKPEQKVIHIVFHAALAIGGTEARGVNGYRLGPGWRETLDLKKVLSRAPMGFFNYDNRQIRVYLSRL